MPRFLRLVLMMSCICFFALSSQATNYYTYTSAATNGFWNVAGTWTTDPSGVSLTGSAVPANNDVVTILNGFTVNLNANVSTTGLSITINNGGTLDLSTYTMAPISVLSGSGTLRLQSVNYPTITTNNFLAGFASGATVEYYDFGGSLPVSINYPNLRVSNSTSSNHAMAFSNTAVYNLTVFGNLTTQATGAGTLALILGTQGTNIISMSVNGNATIGANTTFGVGVFNIIHAISLWGNLTNNGTVHLSNGALNVASTSGAADVTFRGATDNTLACNNITNLYTLTVDKGSSSSNILSVTSTNTANLIFYSNGKLIHLVNGTIRLGANINIPRLYGSGTTNYEVGDIGITPMFWVDGATVNSPSALVVYGKFRITAGSFTVLGGEGSVIRLEGQYIIEGGTFTTEKFRPSTEAGTHRGSFTMSGGTFNAQGTASNVNYARFSLPFPDQVFIISGGTINVSNPQATTVVGGGIHIGCNPANYHVTGGTFNAILSGTASIFTILSTAPFYDLNILRTGGTPTTVRLSSIGSIGMTTAQPLVVLNNFTIAGANTPTFDANGLNVTVGGNFTINTGATYTPGSNTTIFNGAVDQAFNNSGTITTGLSNMTVSKPGGTLTLGGSASALTVAQTLTLTSGILNDGGKTIQANGNIYNQATHTGTGSITLGGAAMQTLSGNGNGIYGNLTLNNVSTPGARATADLTVSGVLTLAGTGNSLFDINQYTLSLTSASATALTTAGNGFSSAKMVRTLGFQSDGGIRKTFGNLTAFKYEFGVGTSYTPATIQLTAAPTTYGTLAVKPVSSRNPFVVAGNTNNLNWYWRVVSAGFVGVTTVSHTYRYVEGSVAPAGDDANYVPARYDPTTWTVINDLTQVDQATNDIFFTNVSYLDGEFTAGVSAAFGIVKVFYSKRSGNWSDTGAGTAPWSNTSHSGPDATTVPTAGDHVYIGDGSTFNHTITVIANGATSGGMEISLGSTLNVGTFTGHNFGTFDNTPISGSGALRISSATPTAEFPAGDFGNFIRASGGVVEYYTTGTQDFTIPLSSASPTGLPLITYKNLVVTPGTGRFIQMPNQDMQLYGNLTVQGASSTGVARLNSATARMLTVNGNVAVTGGSLAFQNTTAQTLDIDGSVNVSAGADFSVSNAGSAVTNLMIIDGSLVNNGVFDMSKGTFRCNVTFSSTANTSITGTGATTDFHVLTVSKGTNATPVLDVNATAFSLTGSGVPLVLSNGTFRLTSSQSVIIANGTDFTVPSTARLSANGGTMELLGASGTDLLLSGTLEVLAGAINVGTAGNDNSIEYAATGQPTITASGGTLLVHAQIRRASTSTQGGLIYNQSGTSVVAAGVSSVLNTTRGVFEILNPGSSFVMSGGTLRIVRALGVTTIADLYLQPSAYNVSGGAVEIGAGNTSQTIDINAIIPLYNVTVNGTTNTARLEVNGLALRGSLNIATGCTFNANSLNVSVAGDFTNANTTGTNGVNVGGYQAGSVGQTTTLNGSAGNQTITGVAGNLTNFGNLVISNSFSGGTVTLQAAATDLRVNGALILTSGTLRGTDNTITTLGTVSNSATHTNTGLSAGGITLAGAGQLVTGNGAGKFGNVTLNNGAGAVFGASQEITGRLTFTAGLLNINSHSLILSNTDLGAIAGATSLRYIATSGNLSDGGVTKAFAANVTAGNFIYPIGVVGKYTPANYTLTTGGLGGTITIRPVNSKHPNATGTGTAFIRYYWSVTSNVIIINALTHTYAFVATDEAGIQADYRDARFKGGAWTIGISSTNPSVGRVITFTNTDVQADYTAGEPTAFVNPTTYTSIASGNWESDLSVWDIDPPGTGIGPPQGSFIIISESHTISVTGDAKRVATVEIRGRLNVGITNSHDFGTVTTSGIGERTMQLQSSLFPAGDFSAFTGVSGGTVEYDGNVNLSSTQFTYNNLTFTGAGTKTLGNVDLTINGNFTILQGAVTNAVNNRTVFLASATGDFINNGVFTAGTGPIIVGRDLTNSGSGVIFNGPNGTSGLRIGRNLINSSNATFLAGTDSIGVRGTFNNSATFTANSAAIRVSGNLNNTAGAYTGGSGILNIKGSMTNNASFSAGTGATTIGGSFGNSGASAVYAANANAMTVTGGIALSSGSIFNANTGGITTAGNWNNSSTFNPGTGSVNFVSASLQTLNGATNFYNLSRVNGGALAIAHDINVSNLLTLSNGNIITGSNTVTLTNTATQPITGFGTTAFVDGRLSITYPNTALESRVYPVGKGSVYRPVTIQQTAASTNPVVRVEMINTQPTGTPPAGVETVSKARYYLIDLLSGTMNAPLVDLSFNTNAPTDENIVVPANTRVLRSTTASSGPWTDEGGTGVFIAFPSGHATSGVTSISNPTFFTLGYQDGPSPITLQSFTAELKSDFVELTWATYSETNNDYFTIERTRDLVTFDSISAVAGAGDSRMLIRYSDIDAAPLDGVSYYRLKQTDFDRRYSYSKVVRIVNSNNSKNGLTVYPNPATPGSPLYMRLENQSGKDAFVLITDVTGRVFFSGEVNLNEKVNLYDLKLNSNLERGVYIINVTVGGRREIRKVIVF